MAERSEKKKFWKRLKYKYRFIIFNENTFEEIFWIRLSRLNVFSIAGTLAVLLIIIVTIAIAYTPLKEFIPGYPSGEMIRSIKMNALVVDSLEYELSLRDQYFENLKSIIEGKDPKNYQYQGVRDTTISYKNISFKKSKADSLLRQQVESEERFNLTLGNDQQTYDFNSLHFYTPLKGLVTSCYDPNESHFGVDIVSGPDEVVMATLDGTVLLSTWTIETGYVMQIQHSNDLVSIYKHLSQVLKTQGTRVKAGEAIAIVGNSGELTTGPHLHFELWRSGTPLNPEKFISF
jgi:murein DD-endopeptidase MepM/ murein hydrolase activator NlpD